MTTPILTAQGASLSYRSYEPLAVNEVDLEVRPGAAIGIVGESGCGKTSLARLLVGALAPSAGRVEIEGREWRTVGRTDPARRSVQMIFQDPYASLNPRLTARSAVAEVIGVWERVPQRDANARAESLLREVGLSDDAMGRRPKRLSGGQCQRVGIARALACTPAVLVADEPTSSLDVSVQAQILNLLKRLRDERGLALVLVSHDLSVVRYLTDEAVVMYGGRIVEQSPTEQLFQSPAHPYTALLLDSIPGRAGPSRLVSNEVDASDGCVFAQRCSRIGSGCAENRPALTVRGRRRLACHYPLELRASGTARLADVSATGGEGS